MSEALQTQDKAVLPEDPRQAINTMIKLTQSLCQLADKEAKAMANDDAMSFAILQDEKDGIAKRYVKACSEFRNRISSFKGIDQTLIKRLEDFQGELGEKSKSNNKAAEQMYERAKGRTQSALIAAQEIGQNLHIKYRQDDAINENKATRAGGA